MSIKLNDVQQISEIKGKALINVDGKFAQIETSLLKGNTGEKGDTGESGENGKSAYEIYVENLGEEEALSESEWLESLKGAAGKTGNPGISARGIELRKGESNIEWRASTEVEPLVDYASSDINVPVYKQDIVTKLSFVNVPRKAVYAQIKTVTIFGVNAEGEDVANTNPSIETMPEGTTFPSLGGFDPSRREYDISKIKEIEGNMSIQTVIDDMLAQFSPSLKIVDINKIQLWVSFLDADKTQLCRVLVKLLVQSDVNRKADVNWSELMPVSDIIGPKGDNGVDGKSVELIVSDGYIKWRKADTYEEPTEGWKSILAISDIVDEVLKQINTVVEND